MAMKESRPLHERTAWPDGTQLVVVPCICPVCGETFEVEMTRSGAHKLSSDLGRTNERFRWTCGTHSLADVHALIHGRRS